MGVNVVSLKVSRAYFNKSDPASVIGVDIGSNLEDKARKRWLLRIDHSLFGLSGLGRWRNLYETV